MSSQHVRRQFALSRRRPAPRPGVEVLEDRVVPNGTVTVSTPVDLVDGNTSSIAALMGSPGADGKISLREALLAANNTASTAAAPNTVNVPAGTYSLTGGDLVVGNGTNLNTVVNGLGTAANTVIAQTDGAHRVFTVGDGISSGILFSLSNVTVSGGRENTDNFGGGGILAGGPTNKVTLTNDVFDDNRVLTAAANAPGGALQVQGGDLTITNCTFSNNSSGNSAGGAVYYDGAAGGRLIPTVIVASPKLTVSGTTFTNNTARGEGGGAIDLNDTNANFPSTHTISSSLFSGNSVLAGSADGAGGAVRVSARGGLAVTTSSFLSNSVAGTGLARGGALSSEGGTTTVHFSRLSGNSAAVAARGNVLFWNTLNAGSLNADDNWWASNSGPATNAFRKGNPAGSLTDGTAATFLKLELTANPTVINPNGTSALTADIRLRSDNTTTAASNLVGLPAFPVPAATIFGNAVLGTLSAASTQFVDGVATATYTAGAAGGAGSAQASVDGVVVSTGITINHAPTANNQSVTTNQDTAKAVTLTGSDPNSPPRLLTYTVTTNPAHGTLSGTAPNLTYTPNAGYSGPDSFQFRVNNGALDSNVATVSITVNATQATVSQVSVGWGTQTAALQNAPGGLLLPSGRTTDLPWLNINKLTVTLSAARALTASDVTVTGVAGGNYGPVTISPASGSNTSYVITLAKAIAAADRVTVTIGNANVVGYTRQLNVLPGDFNDDGVVSSADAVLIRNLIGQPYNPFADIDGDGSVTLTDVNLARARIGTRLP